MQPGIKMSHDPARAWGAKRGKSNGANNGLTIQRSSLKGSKGAEDRASSSEAEGGGFAPEK